MFRQRQCSVFNNRTIDPSLPVGVRFEPKYNGKLKRKLFGIFASVIKFCVNRIMVFYLLLYVIFLKLMTVITDSGITANIYRL